MIAVVDYRMGNLKSVERGLRAVGADARITSDPREIATADAVVLPGVGAFADAMASMNSLGETDAVLSAIADGKPFLGICLGQHLLFAEGVEGAGEGATAKGMGLIEGTVVRIPNHDAEGNLYKIPHVGWNSIETPRGMGAGDTSMLKQSCFGESATGTFASCGTARGGIPRPHAGGVDPVERWTSALLAGIPQGEHFYFTHSYMVPDTPYTIAETVHSVRIPAAVAVSDRVFGVQFHPEKSSDAGAKLLANFVRIVNDLS